MLGRVAFSPCATASTWSWKNLSGGATMLSTGKDDHQLCLTYGGYTEANTGMAACVGWDQATVSGQAWEIAAGSEGGTIIRQTAAGGGEGKCLAATLAPDPKTCELTLAQQVCVCARAFVCACMCVLC